MKTIYGIILVLGLAMALDLMFTGCSNPPTATLEPEGIETIMVENIQVETWETIEIEGWD